MPSLLRECRIAMGRVAPLVLVVLLPFVALAQQRPAAGKKSPNLTTEDTIKIAPSPSPSESEVVAGKTVDAEAVTSPAKSEEQTASADELSWRGQIASARAREKAAERAAEEAELRITALRNQLSASGQTPQARNETAIEMDQAGRRLTELRAALKAAADDVALLLESGRLKKFSETQEPGPTLENGSANYEFYRSRYAALTEALEQAERRVQLFDNRVRDVSQRILQTGGKNGGDNFYLAHLQEEREQARKQLEESRTAGVKARSDLDTLREEARQAGVPPGVFR